MEHKWTEFQAAGKRKQRTIAKAKQAHWRTGVHKAATSPEGIWKLVKWARTKRYLPREPAKMPNLKWNGSLATTASGKAAALGSRFFSRVEADLTDIADRTFEDRAPTIELQINQIATEWEVYTALKRAKPDMCPGPDERPNRFLQAMGEPLIQALTALLNLCWAAEYFPRRFRTARTIGLRKTDKPDHSDLGAWRPIALLSTLGKVIESSNGPAA